MRCEMTSPGVKECALRARSTHGMHHAIVEVNIVIGVVLGEVHVVVRVQVPLVVDPAIDLTLVLIALVVIVVFVVAIFHRFFAVLEVYCLQCKGSNKTLTVREQKENAVSAHAIIHSDPAYDDVGEYGQGPKTISAMESCQRITYCRR